MYVNDASPLSAGILDGFATVTASGTTTLITIPASRVWIGELGASVSTTLGAAATTGGVSQAAFTTAGTNVTPAAGTYFEIDAGCGANAATGLTGTNGANVGTLKQFVIVAPPGNSVTVSLVATVPAGLTTRISAWAVGRTQ